MGVGVAVDDARDIKLVGRMGLALKWKISNMRVVSESKTQVRYERVTEA